MNLSVNQENTRAHFQVSGHIYEAEADQLKSAFKSLDVQSIKEVTIDFAEVEHIGSAGIGKLLLLYKELTVAGGKIRIDNLSADLYELFLAMKLDSLFTLSQA